METVYSLSCERPGAGTIFDYVIDRDLSGWWRHEFDGEVLDALAPSSATEVREYLSGEPTRAIIELRCAAATLEETATALLEAGEQAAFSGDLRSSGLLARRAGEVQRARLDALDEVVHACDDAWDEAIERVERARGGEDEDLHGALRTVELLWTSRLAVRRLLED